MAYLTGKNIRTSYGGLLILSDDNSGATTTLKTTYSADGVATPLQISTTTVNVNGTLTVNGSAVTAGGAPSNASYICKTSDATLTNEFALSTLSSGYVKVTTGTGDLTSTSSVPTTDFSGTLQAAQFPALTGDLTTSAGALATTLATVNSNVGSFGNATNVGTFTVNGKGLITAASNTAIQIAESQVTNLTTDLGNKQPLDATLTSIAALGTAADKIAYTTGIDTWAEAAITAAGRSMVAAADAAAQKTLLSLNNVENTALSTWAGSTNLTTLGTVATGTWSATTIAVDKGGTGQTTYTNGQLLIGNTTGNTLTKATLTAPAAGVTITNGTGSITFALANDLSAVEGLASNGMAARTATDTWAVRTITGTSNKVDVTNGDGVSGNPTLTISSTLDLSGNTSVAIPSGAGGTTINAAGKVCVDTTSKTLNFYNGTAETTLDPQRSKSITVENPTSSEKIAMFRADSALTVVKIHAILIGSASPSVTYKIHKGSDLSAAGTAVVTAGSTVTSVTTGTSVTSFDSASIASGDMVWLTTTAQSGTVTQMCVTVYYTKDA